MEAYELGPAPLFAAAAHSTGVHIAGPDRPGVVTVGTLPPWTPVLVVGRDAHKPGRFSDDPAACGAGGSGVGYLGIVEHFTGSWCPRCWAPERAS